MSYVVLARKYRPQSFTDLVGQTPVSQTLTNALSSNRIAHAYIFSGPRGVGKTTTARVLAKCLNCEKGPTTSPCNKCPSCDAIGQGTSMDDVLEIDGASNRGIEQIRELRENAKYAPAKNRYRIYIIDEAHQITKDAFGALLKTLEEPPSHVVFMMATTEVHKIPAPILSRCQRFSLRPIAPELVFNHLKEICKKEKIKVEDDALKNIVRFVEGSLRDALSLLDQAIVFSPKNITTQSLRELLGLLPMELVQNFSDTIKKGEPENILKSITESIQNGIDLTQLGKDLQNHYHMILLAKAGVNDPLLTSGDAVQKQASDYEFHVLERNIRLLARALEEMRRSETPRAIFEVYCLRLGQKTLDGRALVERLEQLEKNPGPIQNQPQQAQFQRPTPSFQRPPSAPSKPPTSNIGFKSAKQEMPSRPVATKPQELPTSGHKINPQFKQSIEQSWDSFVDHVAETKQVLAAALREADLQVGETAVLLTFEKSFSQQLVERSKEAMKPFLLEKFGILFEIQTKHVPGAPKAKPKPRPMSAPPPMPQQPQSLREEAQFEEVNPDQADPEIKKALEHFPGKLKKRTSSE